MAARKTKRVRVLPYRRHFDDIGAEHPAGTVLTVPAAEAATLIRDGIAEPAVNVPPPWPDYDELTVAEVLARLNAQAEPLDAQQRAELLEQVQAYERTRPDARRPILIKRTPGGQRAAAAPMEPERGSLADLEMER